MQNHMLETPVNELIRQYILKKEKSFLDPFALDIAIKAEVLIWSNKKIKEYLLSTYQFGVSETAILNYRKNNQEFLMQVAYAYIGENPGNPARLVLNTPEKKMQGDSRVLKSMSVSVGASEGASPANTLQQIEDFVDESEKARKKAAFKKLYEAVTPPKK